MKLGLEYDLNVSNTVTFLSNITSIKTKDKCPYHLLFGVTPKPPSRKGTCGDMGVVTTKAEIQGKLTNCGNMCIFMGNSVDHSNLNLRRSLIQET
jgi:hypothetical protein